jgi:hypothetical protein
MVFVICLFVSIVVSVIALVIYDQALTPKTQGQEIDKINSYLRQLIVGYDQ